MNGRLAGPGATAARSAPFERPPGSAPNQRSCAAWTGSLGQAFCGATSTRGFLSRTGLWGSLRGVHGRGREPPPGPEALPGGPVPSGPSLFQNQPMGAALCTLQTAGGSDGTPSPRQDPLTAPGLPDRTRHSSPCRDALTTPGPPHCARTPSPHQVPCMEPSSAAPVPGEAQPPSGPAACGELPAASAVATRPGSRGSGHPQVEPTHSLPGPGRSSSFQPCAHSVTAGLKNTAQRAPRALRVGTLVQDLG